MEAKKKVELAALMDDVEKKTETPRGGFGKGTTTQSREGKLHKDFGAEVLQWVV